MALTYAKFISGDTETIDYTPVSAVTGGDVVVVDGNIFMATEDIAAAAKGALHIGGIWEFPKTAGTGTAIAQGNKIYWDADNNVATETAGSSKLIGICAEAAADAATTVRVLSIPQAV